MRHSFISLIVHIVLTWGLLKFTRLGIYALVIGSASFPVIIFILNLIELYNEIGYRQEIKITYVVPLICSVVMGIAAWLTYRLFHVFAGNTVSLLAALMIAAVVYFGQLYVCRKKGIY